MKKTIFLMLCAFFCTVISAEELGNYFHIQVKEGNWKTVEDLYSSQFKDTFFFKAETRTFSVKTTLEKRNQFLNELKKKGYHLETTSDPDIFTLVVIEKEGAIGLYYIDSTAVNNTPKYLLELQKLVDKNIRGNKKDMIRRRENELPGLRLALENAGFEVTISGKTIIIKERKYVREFLVPDTLRKQVSAVFGSLNIPCTFKDRRISCKVTNTQLNNLQRELLAGGAVHKITIEKDSLIKLHPVPTTKFKITISFNNRFEYEKCIKHIKSSSKFTITDQEFEEHSIGINLCTLSISSKKADAAEIRNEIWRMVRKAGTRVRERDIKINKLN